MIDFSDKKQVYKLVTQNNSLTRGESSTNLAKLFIQGKITLGVYDEVSDMIWQSAGSNSVVVF